MIKINLVIKRPPLVRWRVVARIGAACGLLSVLGIAGYVWWADLLRLQHEVIETKRLAEDYSRVADQMDSLQAQLDKLEADRASVAQIARNQAFSQAAVLEAILITPADVTLTKTVFTGAEVRIMGQARSFAGAMQYLAYLRAAALLRGVEEESLTTAESGQTSFTFSARIREGVTRP